MAFFPFVKHFFEKMHHLKAFLIETEPYVRTTHPTQPRSKYFGEELQMDASQHVWFGSTKTHLHTAIDDATGMIVAGWFDTQETRNGYYQITKQFLTQFASCHDVQSCWVAIIQEQIAQALVTFAKRTVDMGNGIRLGGKYCGTFDRYGNQVL